MATSNEAESMTLIERAKYNLVIASDSVRRATGNPALYHDINELRKATSEARHCAEDATVAYVEYENLNDELKIKISALQTRNDAVDELGKRLDNLKLPESDDIATAVHNKFSATTGKFQHVVRQIIQKELLGDEPLEKITAAIHDSLVKSPTIQGIFAQIFKLSKGIDDEHGSLLKSIEAIDIIQDIIQDIKSSIDGLTSSTNELSKMQTLVEGLTDPHDGLKQQLQKVLNCYEKLKLDVAEISDDGQAALEAVHDFGFDHSAQLQEAMNFAVTNFESMKSDYETLMHEHVVLGQSVTSGLKDLEEAANRGAYQFKCLKRIEKAMQALPTQADLHDSLGTAAFMMRSFIAKPAVVDIAAILHELSQLEARIANAQSDDVPMTAQDTRLLIDQIHRYKQLQDTAKELPQRLAGLNDLIEMKKLWEGLPDVLEQVETALGTNDDQEGKSTIARLGDNVRSIQEKVNMYPTTDTIVDQVTKAVAGTGDMSIRVLLTDMANATSELTLERLGLRQKMPSHVSFLQVQNIWSTVGTFDKTTIWGEELAVECLALAANGDIGFKKPAWPNDYESDLQAIEDILRPVSTIYNHQAPYQRRDLRLAPNTPDYQDLVQRYCQDLSDAQLAAFIQQSATRGLSQSQPLSVWQMFFLVAYANARFTREVDRNIRLGLGICFRSLEYGGTRVFYLPPCDGLAATHVVSLCSPEARASRPEGTADINEWTVGQWAALAPRDAFAAAGSPDSPLQTTTHLRMLAKDTHDGMPRSIRDQISLEDMENWILDANIRTTTRANTRATTRATNRTRASALSRSSQASPELPQQRTQSRNLGEVVASDDIGGQLPASPAIPAAARRPISQGSELLRRAETAFGGLGPLPGDLDDNDDELQPNASFSQAPSEQSLLPTTRTESGTDVRISSASHTGSSTQSQASLVPPTVQRSRSFQDLIPAVFRSQTERSQGEGGDLLRKLKLRRRDPSKDKDTNKRTWTLARGIVGEDTFTRPDPASEGSVTFAPRHAATRTGISHADAHDPPLPLTSDDPPSGRTTADAEMGYLEEALTPSAQAPVTGANLASRRTQSFSPSHARHASTTPSPDLPVTGRVSHTPRTVGAGVMVTASRPEIITPPGRSSEAFLPPEHLDGLVSGWSSAPIPPAGTLKLTPAGLQRWGKGEVFHIRAMPPHINGKIRAMLENPYTVEKNVEKNADRPTYCMERAYALSNEEGTLDAGWDNFSGPCNECRRKAPRQCAFMIAVDIILYKGSTQSVIDPSTASGSAASVGGRSGGGGGGGGGMLGGGSGRIGGGRLGDGSGRLGGGSLGRIAGGRTGLAGGSLSRPSADTSGFEGGNTSVLGASSGAGGPTPHISSQAAQPTPSADTRPPRPRLPDETDEDFRLAILAGKDPIYVGPPDGPLENRDRFKPSGIKALTEHASRSTQAQHRKKNLEEGRLICMLWEVGRSGLKGETWDDANAGCPKCKRQKKQCIRMISMDMAVIVGDYEV